MHDLHFPIGQKVICLHDHFPPAVFEVFDATPIAGHVYTISDIFWAKEHITQRDRLSICLTELPPIHPCHGGFSLWRFRLLEDEKRLRLHRKKRAQTSAHTLRCHDPLPAEQSV